MATVMASGDVAHGQMTSGFRPWAWNTFKNASHDETDPTFRKRWKQKQMYNNSINYSETHSSSRERNLQGLAPSATISIRREARLVSLWSLCAIIAQCRSRHFTRATRATGVHAFVRAKLLRVVDKEIIFSHASVCGLPLCMCTRWTQDSGQAFITAYGTLMVWIRFITLWNIHKNTDVIA